MANIGEPEGVGNVPLSGSVTPRAKAPLVDELNPPHGPPDEQFLHDLMEAMPSLRRFGLHLCQSHAMADDLTQDTLERAIARHHQFHRGTNLKAWLFTILKNCFWSDMRRSSRRGPHVDISDFEHLLPMLGEQNGRVEMRDFARAMDALSSHERVTLYLVGIEGLSYAEASEMLNVEIGTIKSRTSRARQKLGLWLQRT